MQLYQFKHLNMHMMCMSLLPSDQQCSESVKRALLFVDPKYYVLNLRANDSCASTY